MRELMKHRRRKRIIRIAKDICVAAGIFAGIMFWGTMTEIENGAEIDLPCLAAMLLVEAAAALILYMACQALDAVEEWEDVRFREERRKRHSKK